MIGFYPRPNAIMVAFRCLREVVLTQAFVVKCDDALGEDVCEKFGVVHVALNVRIKLKRQRRIGYQCEQGKSKIVLDSVQCFELVGFKAQHNHGGGV